MVIFIGNFHRYQANQMNIVATMKKWLFLLTHTLENVQPNGRTNCNK